MLKLKLILLGCIILMNVSQAQLNLDSLKTVLSKTTADSTSIKKLLSQMEDIYTTQIDATLLVGNWIIDNCKTAILKQYQAKANINIGLAYIELASYKECIVYFTNAEKIAEEYNLFSIQSQALNEIGNMYFDNKQLEKAVEYFKKSIAVSKKNNFLRGAAITEYNLGGIILETGYANKDTVRIALNMMLDGLKTIRELKDSASIITLISGISQAYIDYEKLDSALILLTEAGRIIKLINKEEAYTTHYIRIGKVLNDAKKYDEAIANYQLGLQYAIKYKQQKWAYNYYTGLAETYENMGDFKQANYYNKLYSQVHDSLINKENFTAAADIQNKYERQKKDNEILKLDTINKQKSQINKILTGTSIGLLLLGVLGYKNFKNKQKIADQQKALQNATIVQLEKDKQLMAVDAMLKGQEEERTRIAKDLHDGLGGMLSGTKLSFMNMKENLVLTPENAAQFDKSLSLLDNTIADLRKVAHNLMPEALVKFGLNEATRDFCDTITGSSGINIVYQHLGEQRKLEATAEVFTYRILQELVNNAVKHAKAKQIFVQLTMDTNKLSITVEDDGKGFSINDAANSKGAGLSNIKYRVQYLNGTIDVITAPGNGTSVNIELKA